MNRSFEISGKLLVAFCFVLLFSGCAVTTVHLNNRYLSAQETTTLVEQIEGAGMNVELNQHEFPQSIDSSSLLYSPLIEERQAVSYLLSLMDSQGWDIQRVQPLLANNHWFKKNSLGLYLLPYGVLPKNRQARADLAGEYKGYRCNTDIRLQLYAAGNYQLEFTVPPPEASKFAAGKWRITEFPYLELVSEDNTWWFYFEIKQNTELDNVSHIDVIRLHPMNSYPVLSSCLFEFGVRR